MRSHLSHTGSIFIGYFGIAILLTYPLIFNLNTHLPIGTEPAATVPLFNLWTLIWNAERIATLYQGYWHAPIFFPTPGAFALSEPQPLTGLLFAPLFGATTNAPLAYNLVFLLHLTLNGVGAYCLTKRLERASSSHTPAFVAGLFAQTLPFVSNEWGVLQLTALYPIFFTFTALIIWTRHPTTKHAILLAIWMTAVFWTSVYYGLFLIPFITLYGLLKIGMFLYNRKRQAESESDLLRRFRSLLSAFRTGLLTLAITALLLFPMITGQLRYTAEYSRSEGTIQNNSAQPIDYLRLDSRAWGNQLPWLAQEGGSGQRLYPGAGLLLLGMLGAVMGWRRGNRWWVSYALLGIIVAFWLSLGLNWQIEAFRPYDLIREWVPGYRQLRSPFRLAVFVQIFLLSLAGFALSGMTSLFRKGIVPSVNRRPQGSPLQGMILLLGVVVMVTEVLYFPARLYAMPPNTFDAPWIAWFRAQPPGAAVYVPFVEGSQASRYQETTLAMIQALSHRHPLANGYSGFFPERHNSLKAHMQGFPSYASITTLQAMGVRYIIVNQEWKLLSSVSEWEMLRERYRDGEMVIFEIEI